MVELLAGIFLLILGFQALMLVFFLISLILESLFGD